MPIPYPIPVKSESLGWAVGETQTSVFFKNSSGDNSQDLITLTCASQILIYIGVTRGYSENADSDSGGLECGLTLSQAPRW